MTNSEKFKTAEERVKAFQRMCMPIVGCCAEKCKLAKPDRLGGMKNMHCFSDWLEMEAEEEKPMPCPFCGGECSAETIKETDSEEDITASYEAVMCYGRYGNLKHGCGFTSIGCDTKAEAIAAHNRVCKAVAAYKEREVK